MTVFFDTGSGKHRRLINITEVGGALTPEYPAALLALHCMLWVRHYKCLSRKGTHSTFQDLGKMPRFTRPHARDLEVEIGDLLRELEEFTCAIYGNSKFTSVDELRFIQTLGQI